MSKVSGNLSEFQIATEDELKITEMELLAQLITERELPATTLARSPLYGCGSLQLLLRAVTIL